MNHLPFNVAAFFLSSGEQQYCFPNHCLTEELPGKILWHVWLQRDAVPLELKRNQTKSKPLSVLACCILPLTPFTPFGGSAYKLIKLKEVVLLGFF